MNRSTADAILSDLGQRLGMPGLRLDDMGCCQLVFERQWLVSLVLHPSGDRLMLHCPITTPEATDLLDAATLLVVLRGNFMGGSALGGSLAVAPDRRVCVQFEVNLSGADALQQDLERLLQAAQTWASRLANGPARAPRRSAGPSLMTMRA